MRIGHRGLRISLAAQCSSMDELVTQKGTLFSSLRSILEKTCDFSDNQSDEETSPESKKVLENEKGGSGEQERNIKGSNY